MSFYSGSGSGRQSGHLQALCPRSFAWHLSVVGADFGRDVSRSALTAASFFCLVFMVYFLHTNSPSSPMTASTTMSTILLRLLSPLVCLLSARVETSDC